MQKTLKNALSNFVIFPMMATNFLLSPSIFVEGQTTPADQVTINEQIQMQAQAAKIDAYFEKYDMPRLVGYGMTFVTSAIQNGVDPYLVPAIAVRESSGGNHGCIKYKENVWGWSSCRAGLGGSIEVAIGLMNEHLGGNRESTSHYYDGKPTQKILNTYNPESIMPGYAASVIRIMASMDNMDITDTSSDKIALSI